MAKFLLPPSPHILCPPIAHLRSSFLFLTPPPSLRRFSSAPAMVASVPDAQNANEEYPTGEFVFREVSAWRGLLVKLRLLFAFPWERVRKGSVLSIKLRGQISDQLQSRFSPRLSLPQICENLMKAAYDPRVAGVYLQIEPLNCGWGKADEIRRSILNFKKSGKFIVGYIPICGEKEYYIGCACEELYAPPSAYISMYGLTVQASFLGGVLEKIGVEPEVQRIGKYKSAGDQLSRKSIEDIENFIDDGVFKVERLKEEDFITDLKYDDEVMSLLQKRLGQQDKTLRTVDYRKYNRVRKWSLGLTGGKDTIAVIRASGSISRVRGPFSAGSSGVIGEQFIEKIRSIRESKKHKAVIVRIDSPGGDALASDLVGSEAS